MRDTTTFVNCNLNDKWIICRICLKTSSDKMLQIFNEDETAENLVGKIEEYGGVTFDYSADLPGKICTKCLMLLKASHKFRTLCQSSQRQLMALLQLTEDTCSDNEAKDSPAVDSDEKSENIGVGSKFVKTETDDDNKCVTYESYDIEEEGNSIMSSLESNNCEFIELHSHTIDFLEDESNQNCISDEVSYLSNEHFEIINQNESSMNSGDNVYDISEELNDDISSIEHPKENIQIVATGSLKQKPIAAKTVRKTTRKRKIKTNSIMATNEAENSADIYEEPTYVCCHCGNVYNEKAKLTLHMKFHTKEKPHECEICHKRFAQTPQLARHMNSHTGTRPFKCKFCDSSFADPSTCIKHQRIHTNERPYKCETCGKSFSYSNVLKVHIMTHTGEKPHKCQYCGKKFAQSHHKRTHERTHNQDALIFRAP